MRTGLRTGKHHPERDEWLRQCIGSPSRALLSRARKTYGGELLAIIARENVASQNVCRKLGFAFWKQAPVDGDLRNLYILSVSPPPSSAS